MTELRGRWTEQQGFTLVELLLVMVLAGIIGGAVITAVVSSGRAERAALDLRENTDAARLATEWVRDEIRSAWGVCAASDATAVTLWAHDGDGSGTVSSGELHTFAVVDGELQRWTDDGAPRTLVFGVGAGSGFAYVDDNGQPAEPVLDCAGGGGADRGEVSAVTVVLEGDRSRDDRVDPVRVEMTVALRNIAVTQGGGGDLDVGPVTPGVSPVASFTQSCTGLTCIFDASASSSPNGAIEEYRWTYEYQEFPTVIESQGREVTAELPYEGEWLITLIVVDVEGASEFTQQYVVVSNDEIVPAVAFTYDCTDLNCTFTPDVTLSPEDEGGDWCADWYFGDVPQEEADGSDEPQGGDGTDTVDASCRTLDEVVSYTYPAEGAYTASLIVRDRADETTRFGSANRTVMVTEAQDLGLQLALQDQSYWQNKNNWRPRVRVTVAYADGTPVVEAVVIYQVDGGVSARLPATNAEGRSSLELGNTGEDVASVLFTVVEVEGETLANGTPRTISLTRPSTTS